MAKWADYGISAVRFNAEGTHIDSVKVHVDYGDGVFGAGEEWARTKVVSAIDDDEKTFVTILKKDGNWSKGQEVHTITVNGVKYIRTDKDKTAKDNLDNLPEF